MHSRCLPALTEIYDTMYIQDVKVVTRDVLERIGEIGLAWWICDDGSFNRGYLFLHTESFSFGEHEIIKEWFADQGIRSAICTNRAKGKNFMLLHKDSVCAIRERIVEHIPASMLYKVGDGNRSSRVRVR